MNLWATASAFDSDPRAESLACLPGPADVPAIQFDRDILAITSCVPLDVGSSVTVSGTLETSISGKYRLMRIGQNDFEISLAIRFHGRGSGAPAFQDRWESRVNSCLPYLNSRLFGPNDEKISLRLVSANRAPGAITHVVTIKEREGAPLPALPCAELAFL